MLSSCTVFADQSLEITYQNSKIEVFQPLDLVSHIFAHIEGKGSPASLYDPQYIGWIQEKKQESGEETIDLKTELVSFQKKLESNMILFLLNFFPVYYESTEDMISGLKYVETGNKFSNYMFFSVKEKHLARYMRDLFKEEEQRSAVGNFAEITLNEYETFYQDYWGEQKERYQDGMELFKEVWISQGYEVIEEFFAYYGKTKIHIYLSEGIRRNGRGFQSSDKKLIQSAVKLPETIEEADYSYMVSLHEMIHQISNPVVSKLINFEPNKESIDPSNQEGIKIHNMLEMGVVYTQYWLMQGISLKKEQLYLEFVSEILSPVSNQQEFEQAVDLSEELKAMLKELVTSALAKQEIDHLI